MFRLPLLLARRAVEHVVPVLAATLWLTSLSLLLIPPLPIVAIGTWVLVLLVWRRSAPAIQAARGPQAHSVSMLELVPLVLGLQIVLDLCIPNLGSSLVLLAALLPVTHQVKTSWFPSARLHH